VDAKPQLKAPERTAPVLPVRPRSLERQTSDCLRSVATAHPRRQLHVVVDNHATREPPPSAPGWPAIRG
jgi:hypothetical protein